MRPSAWPLSLGVSPSAVSSREAVVPGEATVTHEGLKGAPDATLHFEVRDDRPECVEITIRAKPEGRGIRSADLAEINLDNMAVGVFAQLGTIGVHDQDEVRDTWKDVHEARAGKRGGVTRAELEQVARVYREHAESGRPTQAVAALLDYSPRTAARRVKQAEEADLLPKSAPGKRRV